MNATARDLRFHNVTVADQLGPALLLADAANVEINGFATSTPSADAPVIQMQNVAGVFVHGCRAAERTDVFLHIAGAQSRDIVLSGNQLKRAARTVSVGEDVGASTVQKG